MQHIRYTTRTHKGAGCLVNAMDVAKHSNEGPAKMVTGGMRGRHWKERANSRSRDGGGGGGGGAGGS